MGLRSTNRYLSLTYRYLPNRLLTILLLHSLLALALLGLDELNLHGSSFRLRLLGRLRPPHLLRFLVVSLLLLASLPLQRSLPSVQQWAVLVRRRPVTATLLLVALRKKKESNIIQSDFRFVRLSNVMYESRREEKSKEPNKVRLQIVNFNCHVKDQILIEDSALKLIHQVQDKHKRKGPLTKMGIEKQVK